MTSNRTIKIYEIKNPRENMSQFPVEIITDQQQLQLFDLSDPQKQIKKQQIQNNYQDQSLLPKLITPISKLLINTHRMKSKDSFYSFHLFSTNGNFVNSLNDYKTSNFHLYLMRFVSLLNAIALMMFSFQFRIEINKTISLQNKVSYILQIFCNLIFTIDILLGCVIQGAIFIPNAYLKKPWNIINFIITISCWSQIFIHPIAQDASFWYQFLYFIKCLRVLKLIQLTPSLKHIFQAFLRTIPSLGQTFFPLIIILIFYSILGLHLFQGATQYRCRLTPQPYHGEWQLDQTVTNLCGSWQCPENLYCGSLYDYNLPANLKQTWSQNFGYGLLNYNNIFSSAFTVSHFIFMNNWSNVMFLFSYNINKYATAIYFVSLSIFLFYIISNLLLVSLYKSFVKEEKQQSANKKIQIKNTNKRKKILTFKQSVIKKQLPIANLQVPNNQFPFAYILDKKFKQTPIIHNLIKKLSPILILLSSIIIGYDYDGISHKQIYIVGIFDLVFTFLFFLEIILVIYLEKRQFFDKGINIVDLIVLVLNLTGIIYTLSINSSIIIGQNPVYLLLRNIKIVRIIKLVFQIQFFNYQKKIIRIFFSTLKKMINFILMWICIVITQAVIGIALFGYKARFLQQKLNLIEGVPLIQNFQGIYKSIVMIFLAFQNQNWEQSLYIFYSTNGGIAILFYLIITFTGHIMLIRLFMAVFLDYFIKQFTQQQAHESQNIIQTKEFFEKLIKTSTVHPQKLEISQKKNHFQISQIDQQNSQDDQIKCNKQNAIEIKKSRINQSQKSSFAFIPSRQQPNNQKSLTNQIKLGSSPLKSKQQKQSPIKKYSKICIENKSWKYIQNCILIYLFIRFAFFERDAEKNYLAFHIINNIINSILFLEFIFNVLAYGLFKSKQSYLRRCWINPINFIIVISCILNYAVPQPTNQFFCNLKTLRFLSIIYQDYVAEKQMKLIIESIRSLAGKILKLIFLYFIFLLVVSVIPLKLIKSIYFCTNPQTTEVLQSLQDCMDWGGNWISQQQSFSNILNSLLLLYEIVTSEGWIHYMKLCKYQFKSESWDIFFVMLFFFCNFCMLSMFIGLIVETYTCLKFKRSKMNLLTPSQKTWFLIKNNINSLIPQPVVEQPNNFIRNRIYLIIQHTYYQWFFDIISYINVFILAISIFRSSYLYQSTLNCINSICLILYCIDTVLKVIVAFKNYFYIPFSKSQLISTLYYIFCFTYKLYLSPQIYNDKIIFAIAICFQLARCLRCCLKFMWSRMLINAVIEIIPKSKSVLKILLVILFIYASIGTYLFAFLRYQDAMNGYELGFTDLFTSFLTLIKIATNQKWFQQVSAGLLKSNPNMICVNINTFDQFLKYGQMGCGTLWAYPFFLSFHLIFSTVILNLFIASMLSAYDQNYQKQYCSVNIFQLGDTLNYWKKYDPKGQAVIPYKKFWKLSSQIAIIFGVKKQQLIINQNKQKFLKQLNIPIYENSIQNESKVFCFKFHDVITSFSKISMRIKSEEQTEQIQVDNPVIKKQLQEVQTKINSNLYKNYQKINKINSAKMLVIMSTLKKLRNWRCLAVLKEKKAVSQISDIFKIKEKKDQKQRQNQHIIASNIKISAYIDDEIKKLAN